MTQRICTIIALLILITSTSFTAAADPKSLTVVYNTGVAPLKYIEKNGQPAGMFPELWKLWGEKAGYSVHFLKADTFAESIEALKTGKADLHAGLFKTSEREQFLSYSNPILHLDYFLFSHPAVKPVNTLQDTSGLIVGIQAGGFTERYVRERIPANRIAVYPSFSELFAAALKGEVKTFVATRVSLNYFLNTNRLANNFAFDKASPLYSQVYYTAAAKKNESLIPYVNKGLSQISKAERLALEKLWISDHSLDIPSDFAALLTEDELGFLAHSPSLKVAHYNQFSPLEFVSDGEPSGFAIDYIQLLAEKMGVELDFIPVSTQKEAFYKLNNDEIDLLLSGTPPSEMRKKFLFSSPYLTSRLVLLENRKIEPVQSWEQLPGLRIAVTAGSMVEQFLQKSAEPLQLLSFTNSTAAIKAVNEGKADICFDLQVVAENILQKTDVANIRLVSDVSFMQENEFSLQLVTQNKKSSLSAILDKAIKAVSREQISMLQQKWFVTPTANLLEYTLTDEEIAWLRKHPIVSMGIDPSFAPFEFVTASNQYSGMAEEYMRLISTRLGVTLQPVLGITWAEALEMAKKRKIDILPCVGTTEERKQYFSFTAPYLQFLRAIITPEDSTATSLSDLTNLRVAVQRDSSHHGFIKEKTTIQPLLFDTFEQAMLALSRGQADAVLGNLAVASYTIRNLSLSGLKISGYASEKPFQLSIAVRKDWPHLTSILNKALQSITPAEHNQIRSRWVDVRIPEAKNLLHMSLEDRAWIARHPVIKVAHITDYPPFSFLDHGKAAGFSIDFLEKLAQPLGIKLEYVYASRAHLIELGKFRDIDIIHTISQTNELLDNFLFTKPYKTVTYAIYVDQANTEIQNLQDLTNTTILAVTGDQTVDIIRQKIPSAEILLYDSYEEVFDALAKGKGDATIQVSATAHYYINQKALDNIKTAGLAHLEYSNDSMAYSLAIRKDWPVLQALLEKVTLTLPSEELNSLHKKWFGTTAAAAKALAIPYTDQENAFLSIHKTLTFSETDWWPLSIIDKKHGRFEGVIADYLNLISERSGLIFSFLPSSSWNEVLEKYYRKEIDIVPALSRHDVLQQEILLTDSFVNFPLVIVTSDNINYIKDIAELNGKKVAVGAGYTSYNYLNQNFPQIDLIQTATVEEALLKVAKHQAYAFVGHMAVAIDALQRLGLKNLKIAGESDFVFDHRIGVDPDYPEVASIINKVLSSISAEEHRVIYNKWLEVEYAKGIDYSLVWQIVGGSVLFLLLFFVWNRKLANEVEARKEAEKMLTSMAANVPGAIFQAKATPEGTLDFIYLSKGCEEYFGIRPENIIHDKMMLPIHENDRQRFVDELKVAIIARKELHFVGRLQSVNGTRKWLRLIAKPFTNQKSEIVYNGLILDVTQRKLNELGYLHNERKINAMSQAVDDALIMIDAQGIIRFWNTAAEKMFGYSSDDAIGKSFHDMVVPEDHREKITKGLNHFAKTGQGRVFGETQYTTAMNRLGEQFSVEVTVAPFFVDEQWFAVGTVKDITERKNAEKKLQRHVSDLERFARLTVEREEKMIDLKKEINQLLSEKGSEAKYTIVE